MDHLQLSLDQLRTRRVAVDCRLGPISVRVHASSADCAALDYFADRASCSKLDYELMLVDDEPLLSEFRLQFEPSRETSASARRFAKGHFLAQHRGAAAVKVSSADRRVHAVVGPDASIATWAFYLKYFVSDYGLRNGATHLKATAVACPRGDVTLIIGRTGGGKSVLMHELMARGMRFVSNTHTLVGDGMAHGMLTAIRARKGGVFDRHFGMVTAKPHADTGDVLFRPQDLFGSRIAAAGRVRNIVVAHYGGSLRGVHDLGHAEVHAFLVQFAQALNVYGMKDDYLDMCGDNLNAFSTALQSEASEIERLARSCRGLYCNVDTTDSERIDTLCAELGI